MDDISEKTIRAAAGLYGIVHVRHLCEIVEHYAGKRYSRAQLNQMMDEQDWHPLRREQGFIYRPDAFAALAEWDSVLARAKGKPFWMPPLAVCGSRSSACERVHAGAAGTVQHADPGSRGETAHP